MSIADPRPGNPASRTFRDLHRTFCEDATSPEVTELAVKLQGEVAAVGYTLCLGVFKASVLPKMHSLSYLLSRYGVTLRQRRLKHRPAFFFVYAEIPLPAKVEWAGVVPVGPVAARPVVVA